MKKRSIHLLVFLVSVGAFSCATSQPNTRDAKAEVTEHDPYRDPNIRLNQNCLPYGQCLPGECGKKAAGCGKTMNCGPCNAECPEGKIRSCECQGIAPWPGQSCPCITPAEQKACRKTPPA